ncbi:MAG: flagellar basal body P-ring formation chaperone FlgA [Thermodesulfovibrionales bacterium]|nr:flagellar basal body P-ring formation chaperone FlgA [Thermodesulfovibrionales bacterium]
MTKDYLILVTNKMILLIFFLCFLYVGHGYSELTDLSRILKEYLKKNYPWAEIDISEIGERTVISELPEKILILKGPPGKTVFLLEFKGNKKVTVTTTVRAFEWIVMSSKPLRKGEILQQDDIYLTLLDVERIPKGSISKIEDAIGKHLNRSVGANMPIVDSMLTQQKKVKRGQLVSMVIESPHFIIRALGEIKDDAFVGKKVKVINIASKKTVTGVLVDENTVKVLF